MPNGIVLWFNTEKGYGFIKAKDGSEIFVRENAITSSGLRTLDEGQKVIFEIETDKDPRGPSASNVVVQ
jgi:CspA family cold shock protein